MTSIFEHAALTIFVASAHHADQGIIRKYSALPYSSGIPFWNTENTAIAAEFHAVAELKKREDEPGYRRARTCQEQMLSKRVLTYASVGVEYRCAAGTRDIDEVGHLTIWRGYTSEKLFNVSLSAYTSFNMDMWLKLMTAYTFDKTSYDEDRLLALAGIAAKFQRHLRASYVAGIFVNDYLPQQLMRTPNAYENEHFVEAMVTYIAPSCSWASHRSCVSYSADVTPFNSFRYLSHEAALRYPKLPFGPVTSARLHLKWQLRRVSARCGSEDKFDWHSEIKLDDDSDLYAYIDRKSSLYRQTEWFCLPVLWDEEEGSVGVSGLVVTPEKATETFRRIGTFSCGEVKSFDELIEQDITLI